MKKKVVTLSLVVALIATAAIGGTLAFFTDNDDVKTNTFTVGNVEIELTEPAWLANGEEANDVYPSEALPKDPTITNSGNNPCFVRIQVTGLDCLKNANLSAEDIALRTKYVVGALGEGWVKGADGYFYYEKPLEKGAETSPLFDSVVIPSDITNPEKVATEFNIVVKAQAVQAQGARASYNNAETGVVAMKAADIATWFTTCGLASF